MKTDKQKYYDEYGDEWKEFAETCPRFVVSLTTELGIGLPMWAIFPETGPGYWMYAHDTFGEALDMCEEFGWEYEVIPPSSVIIDQLLEWKEMSSRFGCMR